MLASGTKKRFVPSVMGACFRLPCDLTYQEVKVVETDAHHDSDGAARVARRDSIELATSTIRPIHDVSRDRPCKVKQRGQSVSHGEFHARLHKTMNLRDNAPTSAELVW